MTDPQIARRDRVLRIVGAGACLVILLGMIQWALALRYWTFQKGYNTSVLPLGCRVATYREVRIDEGTLTANTLGVVLYDPPDDDSAYAYRLVGVRLEDGPYRGSTRGIRRDCLRVR